MLKKCLKHEWKACWKNMALLNGAAIFMGALGGSGFLFSQISELPDLLIVLYLFAYVLIVIAASVMTQVLMIQRYYKNLFTDEGYLTNVLPFSLPSLFCFCRTQSGILPQTPCFFTTRP